MRIFLTVLAIVALAACTTTRQRTAARLSTQPNFGITLPFERDSNQTCTWQEAVEAYRTLAAARPDLCKLIEAGKTDGGYPLHTFIFSPSGEFRPRVQRIKAQGVTILVNNGIHPGEPEGIDASILFVRNTLQNPDLLRAWSNLTFVIIPVYNIDGAMQRSGFSRANQNGPQEYGFRGNARNLDLNRDFVKCDSENARTFTRIFQEWQPYLLIDNHTSNGADYQYVMTLLPTLASKLAPAQQQLLQADILPALYTDMATRGWPMSPYVNELAATPDSGIVGFLDYPRYASGYAALFHCIGFTTETHMLKPFVQRLRGTEALMVSIAKYAAANHTKIHAARESAAQHWAITRTVPLDWSVDLTTADTIAFKGYTARRIPSKVHSAERTYYDRSLPFTKQVPFYNTYKPKTTATAPAAYIIPQEWHEVVQRLQANQVPMQLLANDTSLMVTSYRIRDFQTRNAYEGHYLHYNITTDTLRHVRRFKAGDWLISLTQKPTRYETSHHRYVIETLEPNAPDSWFAWNIFDGILMQKEYFSDYVFEDLAEQFLAENLPLKAELNAKMAAEPAFAKDADAVLRWVYVRSPWYEPTHRLYPVARVE